MDDFHNRGSAMITTQPPPKLFKASQALVFLLAFVIAFTVREWSWILFFSVWAILFLLTGWLWSMALTAYDKLREW